MTPSSKGVIAEGKTVGGLRLSAGLSAAKIESGTPVDVELTLTNATDVAIRVPALFEFDTIGFSVVLPNGEQAPLTLRGSRLAVVAPLRGQIMPMLAPGASEVHTVRLNRFYDMSLYGKYRVVARIPISKDVSVESGNLEFNVGEVETTTQPVKKNRS
jgi:hypothetical protein